MGLEKKPKDKKKPKNFYYIINNTKTYLPSTQYWNVKLNKNPISKDRIKINRPNNPKKKKPTLMDKKTLKINKKAKKYLKSQYKNSKACYSREAYEPSFYFYFLKRQTSKINNTIIQGFCGLFIIVFFCLIST